MVFKMGISRNKISFSIFVLGILVYIYPLFAIAIGPFEPVPESIEVHYQSGEQVALLCDADGCILRVIVDGNEIVLDKRKMLSVGTIIPSELKLYSRNIPHGSFSVETEIECSEYAERPPFYKCIVTILVEEGEIWSVDKRRVFLGREEGVLSTRTTDSKRCKK